MLHTLTAPAASAGMRLDVWLESTLDGCTRSLVSRLIKEGRCAVESGPLDAARVLKAKGGLFLSGGERISLEVPEIEPMSAVAEAIPLTILHEDEQIVVIDKPSGMVVHPAIGHPRGTLVNALLGRYGATLPSGEAWRPGLAHRLDADTSGVICVARTPEALAFLQAAFKERRVGKRYLALIHGAPRADFLECGAWLGRSAKDFRKRAAFPTGTSSAKEAYTSVTVRARCDGYAVVEARPRTGRTHQVRVHLATLGHPVLADAVYGRSDRWPLNARDGDAKSLHRQALHAWALDVPHPSGGRLRLNAPPPLDMSRLLPGPLTPAPWDDHPDR